MGENLGTSRDVVTPQDFEHMLERMRNVEQKLGDCVLNGQMLEDRTYTELQKLSQQMQKLPEQQLPSPVWTIPQTSAGHVGLPVLGLRTQSLLAPGLLAQT